MLAVETKISQLWNGFEMACFVFQTIDIGYNCALICDGREAGLKGVASLLPPQEVRFVPSFVKIL